MKKGSFVITLVSCVLLSTSLTLLFSPKKQSVYSETKKVAISQSAEVVDEVAAIDNFTLREFVKYYREVGITEESLQLLEHLPQDRRIVAIGESPLGKFPVVGYSGDGSSGIVGYLTSENGTEIFDTSDDSQSSTVAEIREAVKELLEKD